MLNWIPFLFLLSCTTSHIYLANEGSRAGQLEKKNTKIDTKIETKKTGIDNKVEVKK